METHSGFDKAKGKKEVVSIQVKKKCKASEDWVLVARRNCLEKLCQPGARRAAVWVYKGLMLHNGFMGRLFSSS